LNQLGYQICAVVDDTKGKKSPFSKIPIYQGEDGLDKFLNDIDNTSLGYVIAIGNPFAHMRMKLHFLLKHKGLTPISFSDPTALICKTAIYQEGLQVMPLAIIHNEVVLGRQCIINTRSLVEHDCVLGDGVEIGPGAIICGRARIGENTWVGANATICPRITIGNNSIIGAGAVVFQDVPDNVVVAGAPARVIKENTGYE